MHPKIISANYFDLAQLVSPPPKRERHAAHLSRSSDPDPGWPSRLSKPHGPRLAEQADQPRDQLHLLRQRLDPDKLGGLGGRAAPPGLGQEGRAGPRGRWHKAQPGVPRARGWLVHPMFTL